MMRDETITALVLHVIGLLCTLVTVPLNTRPQSKPFCLRAYDVLPKREVRQSSGSIEEHMTAVTLTASGQAMAVLP